MNDIVNKLTALNEKYMDLKQEEALIQDKFWGMFNTPDKLYNTYLFYYGDEYRVNHVNFDNLKVYLELTEAEDETVISVNFNLFKEVWLDNGLSITE
ncbi:hypothetical protein ABD91_00685 [Lysinibacillus sphaericus]|uniref:hypothetical protein n=1 Tax=Lysinibacillus sphaericus TaxID=1421 RepID=UPI0018CD2778|nr:hypothetical protein [Lysinibacillus sphaericus]MBG9689443.1 hypothetical protein [Lysinibacillus sphaericus]